MRVIVELHCQRVPEQTFYNGSLIMHSEPGESPQQHVNLAFVEKELEDVAVWLHYMVRLLAESKTEFCVRMYQKGPNTSRPAVAMDLDAVQINKIYESPEAAQIFFAPRFRTRKSGL